jgi:hypothetical protein
MDRCEQVRIFKYIWQWMMANEQSLTMDGLRYIHIHDGYLEYVKPKSLETLLLCVLGGWRKSDKLKHSLTVMSSIISKWWASSLFFWHQSSLRILIYI